MFTIEPKDLAATVLAASKEEVRYYLCGVYFHAIDGKIVLAATDGHRLVQIKTGADAPNDLQPFILATDDVKIILAVVNMEAKIFGKLIPIELHFHDGLVKIGPNFKEYRFKPIDGIYPNYDNVIPKDDYKVDWVGINGEYVGIMQKSIRLHADKKSHGMKMEFSEQIGPIRVYGAPGFLGIIMPREV